MKKINIGMVGCGFAANLHMEAYGHVAGYDIDVSSLATTSQKRSDFSKKYNIKNIYDTLDDMLKDKSIDVIDICTPPYEHIDMIKKIISSGKYVICEKPLTGYFDVGDKTGSDIKKSIMYEETMEKLDDLKNFLKDDKNRLFYAENFVYAPAVQKCKEILERTKSKILLMKGEESHSGSHATHAALWKFSGGGSFIRQGCHPLSAILYLKNAENQIKNNNIHVSEVIADVGRITSFMSKEEKKYICASPVDVEDYANVNISFSDGTKANIIAGDMVLGGVRNIIEVYANDFVQICNIAPNNADRLYNVGNKSMEDVYITEKVENKSGWQDVFINENIARGYVGEMQDFMECIDTGKSPLSDFDLAYDTIKIIYAAYVSAEEGRKITL